MSSRWNRRSLWSAVLAASAVGLVTLLVPAGALAAPVNDDFSTATKLLGAEATASASNAGATKQVGEPSHAGNSGGHSIWFRWVAPSDGSFGVDTCGSGIDTLLAVYTGASVGSLASVSANDDASACGPGSAVVFTAVAGSTYRIAVDGKNGATGPIALSLYEVPANDAFAAAKELTGTESTESLDNTLAGKEPGEPSHAGNGGGHSVWYAWTAHTSGPVTAETCGSAIDTLLAVYTGATLATLTPVKSSDDGAVCGPQSELTFNAVAGTTYRIAVDGKDGATGHLTLSLWARPANDNLGTPQPIPVNEVEPSGSAVGHNVGATKELGEANHAGNAGGHSVWFEFVRGECLACGTVPVEIDTCGSSFDTLLEVYGQGKEEEEFHSIVSNDDGAGCGTQSVVTLPTHIGATYFIAVDGKDGATGHIELRLRSPAEGNNFSTPTLIPSDSVTPSYNYGASQQEGEPEHAGKPGGRSVWYRWGALVSGPMAVSTCGSSFDTLLAVYTGGAVDSLTPVASNDDGAGCGPQSELTFNAVAGTTYQIAVDGKGGAEGNVELGLSQVFPKPPPNDAFSNATPLRGQSAESGPYDTSRFSTREAGEPEHAGNSGGHSVWYSWTAPGSGTLQLDTCESGFDTLLSVYAGDSVGALVPVAEDDDSTDCGPASSGGETRSALRISVSGGTTYRIAVDGYDGASGSLKLFLHLREGRFSTTPPPEVPVVLEPPVVHKLPRCARGKVRRHGKCVNKKPHRCADGKVRKKNVCVVPPPKCRKGEVLRHGRCVARHTHQKARRRSRW